MTASELYGYMACLSDMIRAVTGRRLISYGVRDGGMFELLLMDASGALERRAYPMRGARYV